MTLWLIEPRDPLIVRDGRPFGPNPGARAATLPFPLPSTVVGGLRHKAGLDINGAFDMDAVECVKELMLRGPLLAELESDTNAVKQFLFPAPADALPLDSDTVVQGDGSFHIRIQRLSPRGMFEHIDTNQPDNLALIAPVRRIPNKVSERAPRFWHQEMFTSWLSSPGEDTTKALRDVGIQALESDARMHVSVSPESQTAREGALFQTRGLEFTWRDWEAQEQSETFLTRRLALAAAFEHDGEPYEPAYFHGGLAALGGERRIMHWSKLVGQALPTLPNDLLERIVAARRARVILLTPAVFAATDADGRRAGYRPPLAWVRGGVSAALRAAAVPRAQVVSGWDMAAENGLDERGQVRPRGKPKPTRRLAPSGAVYFVEWENERDARAWVEATWMQNVSDAEQDRRDGFGLAAIGAWPADSEEGDR